MYNYIIYIHTAQCTTGLHNSILCSGYKWNNNITVKINGLF